MGLVYSYGVIGRFVSAILYRPFYHILPRAVNKDHGWARDMDGIFPSQDSQPEEGTRTSQGDTSTRLDTTNVEGPDFAQVARTSPPSPTRQAPEMQDNFGTGIVPEDDSSSDGEDHQMTAQTLITFDVEATEVSNGAVPGAMGTWSAELRSANEVAPQLDEGPYYQITAVSMLPPFLAADAFSMVLTGIIMRPIEALMVRMLGHAYRLRLGLGASDMLGFGVRPLLAFSWQRSINLAATVGLEMIAVGLTWGIVVVGYSALSKAYEDEPSLEADLGTVLDE